MDRAFADEELQLRQEQEMSDSESVNLPRHRGTLNVDVLAADRPSEEDLRQSIKKTSPVKQCETSEIVEETIFDVDEDGEEENVKETEVNEVNEVENERSNGDVVMPTHFSHHPHKTEIAMITEELTQIKNAKSGWDSSEDEEEREEEEEEEKKLEEMPGQIGEFLSSEDTRGDSQGERPEATTPEMTPVADLSNDDILLSTPLAITTHHSPTHTPKPQQNNGFGNGYGNSYANGNDNDAIAEMANFDFSTPDLLDFDENLANTQTLSPMVGKFEGMQISNEESMQLLTPNRQLLYKNLEVPSESPLINDENRSNKFSDDKESGSIFDINQLKLDLVSKDLKPPFAVKTAASSDVDFNSIIENYNQIDNGVSASTNSLDFVQESHRGGAKDQSSLLANANSRSVNNTNATNKADNMNSTLNERSSSTLPSDPTSFTSNSSRGHTRSNSIPHDLKTRQLPKTSNSVQDLPEKQKKKKKIFNGFTKVFGMNSGSRSFSQDLKISAPKNVVLKTHVSYDSETQTYKDLPEEWARILTAQGISVAEQKANPVETKEVLKFYSEAYGKGGIPEIGRAHV